MKKVFSIMFVLILLLNTYPSFAAENIAWSCRFKLEGNKVNIRDMIFAKGIYIAVGSDGVILKSGDGIDWKKVESHTTSDFNAIAFGNDTFIIIGESSMISKDGSVWKEIEDFDGLDVTCFKGMFISIGSTYGVDFNSMLNIDSIFTSKSGMDWNLLDAANAPIYGGSHKGVYSGQFSKIASNKDIAVIAGEGKNGAKLIYSSNGTNWYDSKISKPAFVDSIEDICWGNNQFIAIGRKINDIKILKSKDGINWDVMDKNIKMNFMNIAFDNKANKFYLLGFESNQGMIVETIDTSGKLSRTNLNLGPHINSFYSNKIFYEGNKLYLSSMLLRIDKFKSEKVDFKISVNGKKLVLDSKPICVDGRTLIPLRAISDALGAKVYWDNANKVTSVKKQNSYNIRFIINGPVAEVNDKYVYLDFPPIVSESRTMVPLRFFSESMGLKVTWEDKTKSIIINN